MTCLSVHMINHMMIHDKHMPHILYPWNILPVYHYPWDSIEIYYSIHYPGDISYGKDILYSYRYNSISLVPLRFNLLLDIGTVYPCYTCYTPFRNYARQRWWMLWRRAHSVCLMPGLRWLQLHTVYVRFCWTLLSHTLIVMTKGGL